MYIKYHFLAYLSNHLKPKFAECIHSGSGLDKKRASGEKFTEGSRSQKEQGL